MSLEEFTLDAPDGHRIATYLWPAEASRGLVQIAHGMAEYGGRYGAVAEALNADGWSVIAHDHRGHGPSCRGADLGHFADAGGWRRVLEDLRLVRAHGRERAPEGPVTLLGHSMGSFIALSDQIDAGGSVDGLVLSASNQGGGALVHAGLAAAKVERLRQGRRGKSKLLAFLSFGSFNKGFEGRTEFDWLSRDEANVDRYIADPRCGFSCSNQLWVDLLETLIDLGKPERLRRLPGDLPIYLFAGDRDPVSDGGVGVRGLEKLLKGAGVEEVERRLYPEGRHEMFNETNADDVRADLVSWLSQVRS